MKKTLNYTIDSATQNQSVETFLRSLGYSKKLLTHLRQTSYGLTIDEIPIRTTHHLVSGEVLTVRLTEDQSSEKIVPIPMDLFILYEDDDLIVVNKPAGLPIHPSMGNFTNTLANGLAFYYRQQGKPFVFRVINRLDRDTTGLLILAKHMLSACILSNMVKNHAIKRTYLAIASGQTLDQGTVNAPIARAEDSIIGRCVDFSRGEYALTHYRRLFYDPILDASCVLLRLETGRTHQIRVHMKHIGHPLFGDFLYNPDYRYINRQALHSLRLDFSHPLTGEAMHLTAPVPADMNFMEFTSSEDLWDSDF